MTDAELLLWQRLRAGQFEGAKFRRQYPIGEYITDFCSYTHRLIIEIDGSQHASQAAYDARRSERLARDGYRVIRFWDNEVLTNLDGVLETVRQSMRCPSP